MKPEFASYYGNAVMVYQAADVDRQIADLQAKLGAAEQRAESHKRAAEQTLLECAALRERAEQAELEVKTLREQLELLQIVA
jgi:chromosome segregation ATPase